MVDGRDARKWRCDGCRGILVDASRTVMKEVACCFESSRGTCGIAQSYDDLDREGIRYGEREESNQESGLESLEFGSK